MNVSMDRSREIQTLEFLTSLTVRHRIEKNQNVFEFMVGTHMVKTVFTYKKAKRFAEGVQLGRALESNGK